MAKKIDKIKDKLELIVPYFFAFLSDLTRLFLIEKKIYIDRRSHPFWKTYQSRPPLKFIKTVFFAKILHCFNRIPKNKNKQYIVDCEHVLHLDGESRNYEKMISSANYIERELNNSKCKAIIVPTNGAIKDALKYIKNKTLIEEKFHKVLPAIAVMPKKDFSTIKNGPFTIINIGNKFWGKGTPIALEIFRELRLKHGKSIQMLLVCGDVPADFQIPEGVKVIDTPNLSQEKRTELYNMSHLFLFPCLHDSFGVYLETLSYGVPMLSTNIYDKSEIVIEGKTGFLFKPPISLYDGGFGLEWRNWEEFQEKVRVYLNNGSFDQLIYQMKNKVEELMHNPILLEELSINSQKFCAEELSIERKNKQILDIYNLSYNK